LSRVTAYKLEIRKREGKKKEEEGKGDPSLIRNDISAESRFELLEEGKGKLKGGKKRVRWSDSRSYLTPHFL